MDKIQLTHPEGKNAPRMDATKYTRLRTSLVSCLKARQRAVFQDILTDVEADLKKSKIKLDGKLEWNLFWVSLDLVSNKLIQRDTSVSPIVYSLPE